MNPGQFVDRLRVEAAQHMIDSSTMGLKEIVDACGFGSTDSIRRTFQRVIGITACEYTERFKRAKESEESLPMSESVGKMSLLLSDIDPKLVLKRERSLRR